MRAFWMGCAALLLCALLGSSALSQALQTRPHAPPWPRRERAAVVLEPLPVRLGSEVPRASSVPSVIPLPEARRLGLRPLPQRSHPLRIWPEEPPSPASVDVVRFARALSELCPEVDSTALTDALVSAAESFQVDPFLLAALAHQQSRCHAQRADAYGIGLTRINLGMFQRGMRDGVYRYGKPNGRGRFVPAELPVGRYPFTPTTLRSAGPNAYFAAALISVLEQQCPAVDQPFGSVPHRHAISHFIYGDRVTSTRPEDEILIARRRLLYYYAPYTEPPRAQVGDVALSSPLDGTPRLVMGVMGEPRDNGKRIHLGLDLSATEGEPVRAMAQGTVEFAGVDLRKQGFVELESANAERVPAAAMGPRGLFVRVRHEDSIETLYVHLASFTVHAGQQVERGQELGRVGRTGVHTSDAHLHLGIFVDGLPIDPLPALREYVVASARAQENVSAQRAP